RTGSRRPIVRLYRRDAARRHVTRICPACHRRSYPEEDDMTRRPGVLELAVLGLLHESPMHEYELRKRLNVLLGSLRAFSYGSLYPCLKDLTKRGWIVEDRPTQLAQAVHGRRSKIVYKLTAEGKEQF